MNKLVLALMLSSAFGIAQAEESTELHKAFQESEITSYSKNYFDVSFGVTRSSLTEKDDSDPNGDTYWFNPHGDNKYTGTGYNVGISYTSFQNQNVFLQPTLQYITSGNEFKDKYIVGKLNVGYKFDIHGDYIKSISPKVGVGVFKAIYNEGSNYGIAYNAGVEVGVSERVAIDIGYNYMKGQKSGNHADFLTVGLKYKF